jgi:hypothetical protein
MKSLLLIISFICFLSGLLNAQTYQDSTHVESYQEAMNLAYGSLDTTHFPSKRLINRSADFKKANFANGTLNDSLFNLYEWYLMYNNYKLSYKKSGGKFRFVALHGS